MIKIVAISDTHNQHSSIEIPECDLLIHSGDYSYSGKMIDILELNQWFGQLKFDGKVKQIVTCAGNHDFVAQTNPQWTKEAFTNCIYLDEEPCEVFGLKIYGSAWTPEFGRWAFMADRGEEMARHWSKIPEDTQVLVTHGPPMGILDLVDKGVKEHAGCEELLKKVNSLSNLKLHVFGNLHDNNGIKEINDAKFVNAAICDEQYKPVQPVQVVEL